MKYWLTVLMVAIGVSLWVPLGMLTYDLYAAAVSGGPSTTWPLDVVLGSVMFAFGGIGVWSLIPELMRGE